MTRRVAAIINIAAGSAPGETLCDMIARAFERQGVRPRILTVSGKELSETARALREEGFDIIVAGGGDGTVSAVAREIVGHPVALGVLPLGTLNHFARDLNLPTGLDEAVAVICSGEEITIDVGTINGHTFINNSSLGLYPDQVRVRQLWRDRVGKWLALVVASIIVLLRFRSVRITAEFDGKRIKRRCPMVLVSNNPYKFEPANLTRRDRLDSGVLGLYLLREEGRTGLFRIAIHSLVFNVEEAVSFERYTSREVTIITRRRRVRVALDGEVFKLTSPLRFRLLPGGLRAIAPGKQR
ncbi:MAG TPA: diacylglycerol kinase family protein [Blastocatellia bacterium]|nr:diacylglycerol kinase family protein [Blastocatellia bacterium]